MENCHVVLHATASNLDIVKGTLALAALRRDLGRECEEGMGGEGCQIVENRRTADSVGLIRKAKEEADERFGEFVEEMEREGWDMNKFMFGTVSMRNVWPREIKEDEE
jgi:hypothetical protein